MTLADEYRKQFSWRSWTEVFALLPPLAGKVVLDLGCGIGDQAAELARRGARVIAVDSNEELLREARETYGDIVEFRSADLRALPDLGAVDGLWSSFSAAYFPDLVTTLRSWLRNVRPDGFIALTEVDDLFAHEPLCGETRERLDAYVEEALRVGRYDFRMGRKLRPTFEQMHLTVVHELAIQDRELAFDGPAADDVLAAWSVRFGRMKALAAFCDERFTAVRDDFLRALAHDDHRSSSRVVCCVAKNTPAWASTDVDAKE
jgi:SAM-dependent methyltransferase